ncbi:NAD(P)/FAD-dependent oxidoreductase [Planctomycetes bacterium K23_9]|uniref:NADH:ubiquinone reductase (non-electrogenic) n=1 Tax=Stieleria marina TaxID=1930275 RepID=A0A517NN97_9BACT|nr:NADH dehydrogenase-like protein [Planctomycetes bacterium K23_9]
MDDKHVVIVGGGFAGLNAAKQLADRRGLTVTLIDRRNHHLFQPLLYQVAMAGLSPADIAAPIRSILSRHENVRVINSEVTRVDAENNQLQTTDEDIDYDYLLLACGAMHSYFGHDEWEEHAPGLKSIEQATEIRRRVLSAFERAEVTHDADDRRRLLTFVVVGGGPTGVELAGAIGEMSRFTLARDFRNIDAKLARIILIEAGPRILPMFAQKLSARATRDLESLGVQVWTDSSVTEINADGVDVSGETIRSATVLWAAGVKASALGTDSGFDCDRAGRIHVGSDLSVPLHSNVFVAGDQCAFVDPETERQLPGIAPVATQQGRFIAAAIVADRQQQPRGEFRYRDKGQMATIGRSRAITEVGKFRLTGLFAWLVWLVVHIYFLTGFRNRLFVVLSWAWSFFTFRRGARLIVSKNWRSYSDPKSS